MIDDRSSDVTIDLAIVGRPGATARYAPDLSIEIREADGTACRLVWNGRRATFDVDDLEALLRRKNGRLRTTVAAVLAVGPSVGRPSALDFRLKRCRSAIYELDDEARVPTLEAVAQAVDRDASHVGRDVRRWFRDEHPGIQPSTDDAFAAFVDDARQTRIG